MSTDQDHHLDSVGKLSNDITVKILDDEGNHLAVNEVGELLIQTQFEFLGYYNNPEATLEALDSDNWIHSGDLGKIDEEGYLYIVDRKKDIIKYSNYQINPSEIEEVLERIDGVGTVCVVGIPDLVATDLPAAVIIRKIGSNLTESDVLNEVAKTLPDYKQLRGGVYFVDELPMTPSGKVKKRLVKTMAIELRQML